MLNYWNGINSNSGIVFISISISFPHFIALQHGPETDLFGMINPESTHNSP